MFNKIWLCRYPRPCKFVFDNGYEFKQYFTPLLNNFNIKPVLMKVMNPQSHSLVEWLHQVILNMLVTKDLDNKVFDHIYLWGETLAYIAWAIRVFYHSAIMATTVQDFFGSYMLFNLASVIYWRVVTTAKQGQVHIDHIR